MSLGQVIQALCEEQGWSQTDLIRRVTKASPSAVQRAWQDSTSDPRKSTLQAIADALGVTVAYLYARADGAEAADALVATTTVPDEKRIEAKVDQVVEIVRHQPARRAELEKVLDRFLGKPKGSSG